MAAGSARPERDRTSGQSLARAANTNTDLGPIGAGGSRPMLGRRSGSIAADRAKPAARADTCPTTRVPGASVASRAAGGEADALPLQRAKPPPAPQPGADGFQEVRPRAAAKPWAAVAAQALSAAGGHRPVETRNSWEAIGADMDLAEDGPGQAPQEPREGDVAQLAGCTDEDEEGGTAGGDGDHDDDDGGHGDGGVKLDPDQLKQAWMSHCSVVRMLERRGKECPVETLAAARAQRDAAEQRWRAAKRPHPLFKRLRWAEADLRDAEAKERAHRDELEEHLAQSARRTKELQERLEVDEARTARKRQAVTDLHREGAMHTCQGSERAARVAIEGLSSDITPALESIINQLGKGDEPVRKDLRMVVTLVNSVQEVLRDATEKELAARGPAHFNIGDEEVGNAGGGEGGHDGGGGADGGGGTAGGQDGARDVLKGTRWTKAAGNGTWKKATSTSEDAVAEARRMVRARTEANTATAAAAAAAAIGPHSAGGGAAATGAPASGSNENPANTNDLAEAARREQAAAQQQTQRVLQQQQLQADAQRQQEEEVQRQQRMQRQQEELQRHQAAVEQAAAARAAEEARQRAELVASLTPEELARVAELHAQHAAVGSHVFGTAEASHMAGLVQQSQTPTPAEGTWDDAEMQREADRIMEMSPEELAAWDRGQQDMSAAGL